MDIVRKMRQNGLQPLSKIPHLGDAELDLPGNVSSIRFGTESGQSDIFAQEDNESNEDFLTRTCRYVHFGFYK